MSTFLITSATSQSSSYPIVLIGIGGPLSRYKLVEVPGIEPLTSWSVGRDKNVALSSNKPTLPMGIKQI